MIYARPLIPPTRYGSRVLSIDDSAAKHVPAKFRGWMATRSLPLGASAPGWVWPVLGPGLRRPASGGRSCSRPVKVEWQSGETANVSEQDIQQRATELIADAKGGSLFVDDPGVDTVLASAKRKIERDLHDGHSDAFRPRTGQCPRLRKGWRGGNSHRESMAVVDPSSAGEGFAPQSRQDPDLRSYLLGGAFGRRLDGDYAVPAALASLAIGGKPVKMVCTRADDMRFDCPRSASRQVLRLAWGDGNTVAAMDHHAVAGWPTATIAPYFLGKDAKGAPYDPFAISGADHWYNVGAHRVRALRNDLAERTFRSGYLRSVAAGWTSWAVESFLDEAAHEAGIDSVAFRLSLLDAAGRNAGSVPNSVGGAHRQAAVLARCAQKAGWGSAIPKDVGLGIASTFGQERTMPTWVACAARVRVDRSNGHVAVEKLTLVVDAGTIIHPDSAAAQVEGAALWGFSTALYEGTEFVRGQPKDTNLDSYRVLRMGEIPELDIEFIPSSEMPVGLGEPASTAVAPAIGNAIFAASGARLRHLPIRPEAVRQALAHRA